jgi:hypothetical protein
VSFLKRFTPAFFGGFTGKVIAAVFIALCAALGFGPETWAAFMVEALPPYFTPTIARIAFLSFGFVVLIGLVWPIFRPSTPAATAPTLSAAKQPPQSLKDQAQEICLRVDLFLNNVSTFNDVEIKEFLGFIANSESLIWVDGVLSHKRRVFSDVCRDYLALDGKPDIRPKTAVYDHGSYQVTVMPVGGARYMTKKEHLIDSAQALLTGLRSYIKEVETPPHPTSRQVM